MVLLSHVQPQNIDYVTQISIPVLSLPAVALDLISAPASRTLNTFSASVVTSLLTRETVLRHHWSTECFEVKPQVSV